MSQSPGSLSSPHTRRSAASRGRAGSADTPTDCRRGALERRLRRPKKAPAGRSVRLYPPCQSCATLCAYVLLCVMMCYDVMCVRVELCMPIQVFANMTPTRERCPTVSRSFRKQTAIQERRLNKHNDYFAPTESAYHDFNMRFSFGIRCRQPISEMKACTYIFRKGICSTNTSASASACLHVL